MSILKNHEQSHLLGAAATELTSSSPPAYSTTAVQYSPTQQMSFSPESRNAAHILSGPDGQREWSHSLLSCSETPALTSETFCCPCFVYSSNKARLESLNVQGIPHPSPPRVSLWCCLYLLSPQIMMGQIALQCLSRTQTRERYSIRGDGITDVLISAFCTCCSLVQERREMVHEEQFLRQMGTEAAAPETIYRDEPASPAGFAM